MYSLRRPTLRHCGLTTGYTTDKPRQLDDPIRIASFRSPVSSGVQAFSRLLCSMAPGFALKQVERRIFTQAVLTLQACAT